MKQIMTKEKLSEMMAFSLKPLHPDDIAFLFATGKNELFLRDLLSAFMNRNLDLSEGEYVAREWKKHDLALIHGHDPKVLIEGKSWIHYDAANKGKLLRGSKSVREAMETDIEKMRKSLKRYPDGQAFVTNILFSVEIAEDFPLEYGHLTYGKYHLQGARKNGSYENLRNKGIEQLRSLMEAYGDVVHSQIEIGSYSKMKVWLDFLVLDLDSSKWKTTRS